MEATLPNNNSEEKPLSTRSLQNHLIKTAIGALVIALLGGFLTSYASYYRTNDAISELNKSKDESKQDIKDLKKDVADIKLTLSSTGIYTNNNKEEITQLKNDVSEIKKSQGEMMKLLYDIKSKQK